MIPVLIFTPRFLIDFTLKSLIFQWIYCFLKILWYNEQNFSDEGTRNMWNYLKETRRPIVLYGMGNGADKILDEMERRGIAASGVFASDGFARHNLFRGFEVVSYSEAKERFGEMTVLVTFGTQREDVMALIEKVASENETFIPDVPVVGEGIFDKEYAASHAAELRAVYDMLADEESKATFRHLVDYKLSGRPESLRRARSPREAMWDILSLGANETYLDLGAYTGDTALEFSHRVEGYEAILCVEPDGRNFRRLRENTAQLRNCECYNVGIADTVGEMTFSAGKGRGNARGGKETVVRCETVDHLLRGRAVSYIKMDVEGQERAAICGGAETIRRCRPKMLISAYHRTEDLFAIPLQVKEICPDYRVYLRHHPYIPAWDINYYFL